MKARHGLLLLAPALLAGRAWESPRTPVTGPFPGTTGLSAESCGQRHAAIYEEWRVSTHAHAWVDVQLQAELHKDPEIAWVCINCHIPMSNQQKDLTASTGDLRHPDRRPNPTFDAALQEEGITCLSCHWRQGGIAAVHEGTRAPHPVVVDPELRQGTFCMSCHQAVARFEDTLVCTFDTGTEWKASGRTESCQDCHMPAVDRPVVAGGTKRRTGAHLWPGSLIPKVDAPAAERALFDSWKSGADVAVEAPASASAGQRVGITATITNARAGHMLPTGDPERYLLATLVVVSADGAVVASTTHRVGQVWEWWPQARRLEDNRISPGRSRKVPLEFTMPDGPVQVRLTLDHYRISPENAAYHGLEGYATHRRAEETSVRIDNTGPAR